MGVTYYQPKSEQTDTIERLLRDGKHSLSTIARSMGVSQPRISQIKKRMVLEDHKTISPQPIRSQAQEKVDACIVDSMKALTIRFTPSVFDAFVEACAVTNRANPDDTITLEDFIEECATVRVVEMGLLRRRKK